MILKKLKKSMSLMLAISLTAAVLVGCSNTGSKGEKSSSGSQVKDERKANNELVVAVASEPEAGFDATTGGHGSMTRVFFSSLFKRDKELGMENDLATEYKVSDDKLTWTVKIREDVKFTDGEPLTSEDVVYTYETAKESGSEIDLTMLENITAVDKYTIDFKLKEPQSTFMEKLAYLGIVPKHAHGSDFSDNPIGSGPFKFVQWDKGQQVIAEKNKDYYGDEAEVDKLTMVFLDTDAAYAAVKSGDVDMASITGDLAGEKVEGTKIVNLDTIETFGVEFPMQKSGEKDKDGNPIGNDVTSDESIRKALNIAVDRESIVEGVLDGYGTVSTTGLEKMPWLNEETIIKEDGKVDEAKEILKDGGWEDTNSDGTIDKDGVEAEFKLLYTDGKYRQEIGLAFVEVAKELGIKVNLEMKTWDNIVDEIHSEAVLFGFGSGDPSELYNLYSSKAAGGGIPWDNAGYYKNKTVDSYIDKAFASENEEEALEFWKKAQWDGTTGFSNKGDATYAWLVNVNHVYIMSEDLDIGTPVVQPHGGRIFDNVTEWSWK
ncbi:ABC transporter substrate-binding protein [Romboutsia ilealis]|uniref:ABC transporter substrate-binding protein n=1 Tax=Romboutsia faecis TaxID=2764597 RepID=A0ABR7JR39_9FIRM|nr:ABC transporter substrate-binding protein [Romboutsia faecis]MBC5997393.1 ABC transporter substrate-binding protein [Romboutsia faecis]MRN24974.1 ABC transporter substrate-binding protein [Romboutsia ilealis]